MQSIHFIFRIQNTGIPSYSDTFDPTEIRFVVCKRENN